SPAALATGLLLALNEPLVLHLAQFGIDLTVGGVPHVADRLREELLQLVARQGADPQDRQQGVAQADRAPSRLVDGERRMPRSARHGATERGIRSIRPSCSRCA